MKLTHLSLFSGIGGLDLAAVWAGFETVGQCEWADFPTRVLEKHWPGVPRWRDIKSLTKESFYERTGRTTINLISGGFPCQPFSTAGKRRGEADDRYLWPEMLRVIQELRPPWVVGENVAGIIDLGLDQVLFDLESQGYQIRAFMVPACGANAPHRRYRYAIVAYNANSAREQQRSQRQVCGEEQSADAARVCQHVPNAKGGKRHDRQVTAAGKDKGYKQAGGFCSLPSWAGGGWQMPEPALCRLADGISRGLDNRAEEIKAYGNAVVPEQFYPVFQAIAKIGTEW